MSFVATSPPRPELEPAIENDGWWPDIDPAQIRATQRLDGTINAARLRAALIEAIAATNALLAPWSDTQRAAGHASLADVPAPTIDGASAHLHRYRRAIGCTAAASLIERHRSYDATNDGHQYADKLESPIDDLRRDASWAIADIVGRPRSTIELI